MIVLVEVVVKVSNECEIINVLFSIPALFVFLPLAMLAIYIFEYVLKVFFVGK